MASTFQPAPKEIVDALGARAKHLGITTADTYLREFEACLDGACPSHLLEGMTKHGWSRLMKRASRTLIYDGDGLEFVLSTKERTLADGIELPAKTAGWVAVIVTTPTRDRDGDILETGGAQLDEKGPHLFNHLAVENCGRVLKQLAHTKKVLKALLSIIDTPLGNDVATMYEHGSLRTSHGFLPTKWEPLDDGEGFHILEFKILEVSGVSIPSNPDAGPLEFSRNKLRHPLIKEWGRMKFRERPAQGIGLDLQNLPADGIVITPVKKEACGCQKAADLREGEDYFILETKSVVPFSDSPVSDKAWDASGAVKRGQAWSGVDEEDPPASAWKKFRKIFAIQDGDADKIGSYKFPYHDVEDGKLVLVPKGVAAAIGALNGARGGTKISEEDRKGAYNVLVKAYKKCYPDQDPPELKSADELPAKGVYVEFENSWTDIEQDLSCTVKAYMIGHGAAGQADCVFIAEMFSLFAYVCVIEDALYQGNDGWCCMPWSDDDNRCYYKVAWEMGDDEEPQWTGEPVKFDVTPQVTEAAERRFNAMQTKATMKSEHVKKLASAMDRLEKAAGHEEATPAVANLAKRAHTQIKSVHDDHSGKATFTSAHKGKLTKAMGYCSEGMAHKDATEEIKGHFDFAHGRVKDVMGAMDDGGGEAGTTTTTDATTSEPVDKNLDLDTKGINIGTEEVRKGYAAFHHLKAVEHHDEASNADVATARKGYQPLQDMLGQVDSDSADEDYEEGRGKPAESPDGKAAKIRKADTDKLNTALGHAEALAKSGSTSHIKALGRHAAAHIKAIVKPADPAGEAGENGAEGTEGENGNPPKNATTEDKTFGERLDPFRDEAIDALPDDTKLLALMGLGSWAAKAFRGQSRQAGASGK